MVAMPAAIAIDDLVKRYGAVTGVEGVSLTVDAGSVCTLLGPNGAGKTTTVECVAGFRRPDRGTVRVLGDDPHRDRAAVVARLGVMLQEGGAYQAASPREMLRLFARFYPDPADPEALLERLGLDGVAERRFRGLSGGEKQRLNLALALVGRPRVVLLDEPTAGMDPRARQTTHALIRELRADGVAVLLTTHDLDEAERLADVVAILDRGHVRACAPPAALGADAGVLVSTPATFDAAALGAAVGAPVARDADGRWRVAAGAETIPAISGWFGAQGLPLTGVAVDGGLEAAYLRLTDQTGVARSHGDDRA
jgi:ABC-2 type transport system ATP-binding protein